MLKKNSSENKSRKVNKFNGNGHTNGHQHSTKYQTEKILKDFQIAWESRYVSLVGRKLVLNGRAKFGIFGDGKEIPQIAMTRAMQPGDISCGYYREQSVNFVAGTVSYEEFFSQLYADPDGSLEVGGCGRQMNGFGATRWLDESGQWRNLLDKVQSSSDTSPTGSQMARALGLALASKIYRQNKHLSGLKGFSKNGNEILAASIGDASTSEGLFWEALNAAGVLKVPMAISIWDDGYGISVPKKDQTTKGSISEILQGFKLNEKGEGFDIYVLKAWDYPTLVDTYKKAFDKIRTTHIPAIFHIEECTQPQGHSTSGSHERYKSKERLQWEQDYCCIKKMAEWILANKIATSTVLEKIQKDAEAHIRAVAETAWRKLRDPIESEVKQVVTLLDELAADSKQAEAILSVKSELQSAVLPIRRDTIRAVKKSLRIARSEDSPARQTLMAWQKQFDAKNFQRFNSFLYSESAESALKVVEVKPAYSEKSQTVNGNQVLQACFDKILERDARVFIFGEDVGIGDVNHGLVGLPEKHGRNRIFDTGIREATIIGQGLGMAMRGLRPIAEIQYLDYLIFGLQPIVDDLSTLQYRNRGGQKAPLIIRTRGHRLEGIWHTGSPMGMIINSMRGVYVLVPRNMVQAAGFYNTMLKSDEPALIIECLNGYGLKERLPDNIGEFTLPLGTPEVLCPGEDVTIVTYGSCCRVVLEAAKELNELGISVEVVDVQSLLPFDVNHLIVESIKKTNRVVFVDEDVPGGASAFMMREVLEVQDGYHHLDSKPVCVTAKEHRSPYGSDGDYYAKPNSDDVIEAVYKLMQEARPDRFV